MVKRTLKMQAVVDAFRRDRHKPVEKAIDKLRAQRSSDVTRETYQSRLDVMRSVFGTREEPFQGIITRDLFLRFLAAMNEGGAGASTLTGYRCALLDHQRCNGLEQFAADKDIVKMCKGHEVVMRRKSTPRGTMTKKMAENMVAHLAKTNIIIAQAFQLQYLCSLRVCELILIRNGDFQPDTRDMSVLTVRWDKTASAQNLRSRPFMVHPKMVPAKAMHLAKELCTAMDIKHGDFIFKDLITESQIANAMKKAATELNFPADLEYDGSHVARHAGVTALRQVVADSTTRFIADMSSQNIKRYGETLGSRRARKAASQPAKRR